MSARKPFPVITDTVIASLKRLPDAPDICLMDENTVLKTGTAVRMAEAEALRFVRKHTTIPVPEVYEAYMRDDKPNSGVIIMERVKGDVMHEVWGKLDAKEKDGIIGDLRQCMEQLRSIPGSFVGSVDGTDCEDQIFSDDRGMYGPFKDDAEFREGCIRAMVQCRENHWTHTVAGFIRALPVGKIVLTHNDLHPRNILVREGKVAGIIDWELSGFYPEYWEYVKALYRPDADEPWLQARAIDKVLTPYPLALAVFEHTRDIVW